MEAGDALVAYSDAQSVGDNEPGRSIFGDPHHVFNYFNNHDEYSDIYFDKSCINGDDASLWNVSNYPKEINLDVDEDSEVDLFLRPDPPEFMMPKPLSVNGRKNSNEEKDDNKETLNLWPRFELDSRERQGVGVASDLPTSAGNSGTDERVKFGEPTSPVTQNQKTQYVEDTITSQPYTKDEGKLIFRITRFNKVTQKEKLITKSRRIISKCPHTSMKYYAKGMCK